MIAVDYQIAYMEVLEILKHIPVNEYKKIPEQRLRLFEKYAKKDIDFHYDTSRTLDEQNVSEKAKILIAILFRDYWATEEQREKILASEQAYQKKIEEEKRKIYNSNDLFKNKTKVVVPQDQALHQEVSLTEIKENFFTRFIKKLKQILKIN